MNTSRPVTIALLATCALYASGCTTITPAAKAPAPVSYQAVPNTHFDQLRTAHDKTDRDRLAILAMQGDYHVDFQFQETVPLRAGYKRRQDKTTGGFETVIVVADEPDRIVLQHILVAPGGAVIKHWRQDWHYEARERFEFIADQQWQMVPLDADKTGGAWTQCVFEVSDAPRYCGTGIWNHRYGVSTWTSDRTWRPLPRREYTQRDDYNAINAENRHTVTPFGWTHEQDNTKTLRNGSDTTHTLVREFGFNDYRSITGYDFSPARDYWAKAANYWQEVRAAWSERLVSGATLTLNTEVDGMPIIAGTFGQVSTHAELPKARQREAIETLLNEWTTVSTSRSAQNRTQ